MKNPVLLAVLALVSASPVKGFCRVPQPRLVCAEYFASTVVGEATLVKIESIPDRDYQGSVIAHVYTLHTDDVFRGQISKAFRIYEANDSGRATFEWKVGRKYLLFLFYYMADKSWELDGCGNSGPLAGAKNALDEIETVRKRSGDGTIHGLVSEQALSIPLSGVRVEARGTNGVYTAVTDEKGRFEIKVPPGSYVVHASKAGLSFGPADLTYENPERLLIEPGGCVQIQLASR